MGTTLNILGNHQLQFGSGHEAIEHFSHLTGQAVDHWDFHKHPPIKKTTDSEEIEFFVNYELLESNFDWYKEVKLYTSYAYCPDIFIYLKTLKFSNGCKYSYWQNCVFDKKPEAGRISQFEFCKRHWHGVRPFAQSLCKKLKGDHLIYFNDSEYQLQEDLYHEGASLETLMEAMNSVRQGINFRDIYNRKDEPLIRYSWFYESV